nr:hypothetical protein Iba_chr01eCG8680 [Ipomoea batatas]GMD36032.1 hypothetical protein Iba_scaffold1266549CG0010 [Ipomoea batatas]
MLLGILLLRNHTICLKRLKGNVHCLWCFRRQSIKSAEMQRSLLKQRK